MLRAENLREHDLDDLSQEAVLRVLRQLEAFRGDSSFTTWATAIAVRVAFTELRRRRIEQRHTDAFAEAQKVAQAMTQHDPPAQSDEQRTRLFRTLGELISSELTERQRIAIVAELRGVPTIEVAERLGTNQNALYKSAHDARKKLRQGLIRAGYTPQAIREALEGGS